MNQWDQEFKPIQKAIQDFYNGKITSNGLEEIILHFINNEIKNYNGSIAKLDTATSS